MDTGQCSDRFAPILSEDSSVSDFDELFTLPKLTTTIVKSKTTKRTEQGNSMLDESSNEDQAIPGTSNSKSCTNQIKGRKPRKMLKSTNSTNSKSKPACGDEPSSSSVSTTKTNAKPSLTAKPTSSHDSVKSKKSTKRIRVNSSDSDLSSDVDSNSHLKSNSTAKLVSFYKKPFNLESNDSSESDSSLEADLNSNTKQASLMKNHLDCEMANFESESNPAIESMTTTSIPLEQDASQLNSDSLDFSLESDSLENASTRVNLNKDCSSINIKPKPGYSMHTKGNDPTSPWYHAWVRKVGGKQRFAQCKFCSKEIPLGSTSTTNSLHHHLKTHNIFKSPLPSTKTKNGYPTKIQVGSANLDLTSLQALLGRMCGYENHTFRQVTLPTDQEYLESKGFKCKSVTTISKYIKLFAEEIYDFYKLCLEEEKENFQLFYIIVDEYARQFTRQRYLGVTVVSPKHIYDIGLHRIIGRATAKRLKVVLKNALQRVGLNFANISAMVSDGASAMILLAKKIGVMHQVCHSHGLHLAIKHSFYGSPSEMFYDRREETSLSTEPLEQAESSDEELLFEGDASCEEIQTCDDPDSTFEILSGNIDFSLLTTISSQSVKTLIDKIRKIINHLRCVNVMIDTLRIKTKNVFNKELIINRDCPNRWHSLIETLTRFDLIKTQLRETFEHHGHSEWFNITNQDELLLKQLIKILGPILDVSKRLEKRECSLWEGQLQLDFLRGLFDSLPENCDELLSTLKTAINYYVRKRTSDMALVSVYLLEGKPSLSTDKIQQVCMHILRKLGRTEEEELESNNLSVNNQDCYETDDTQCFNLSAYISKRLAPNRLRNAKNIGLLDELNQFERTGVLSQNLELVKRQIEFINPSSIEEERKFSETGRLIGIIRTRLSDSTLNSLIIAKRFFKLFIPKIVK